MYELLKEYVSTHHRLPPRMYRSPDGFAVGGWISEQRQRYMQAKLFDERRQLLEAIDGWYWWHK